MVGGPAGAPDNALQGEALSVPIEKEILLEELSAAPAAGQTLA